MARNFDGTDDSLSIDSAAVTAAPFTISCWVNMPTYQTGTLVWVGDKDVTNHYWVLKISGADAVQAGAAAGGTVNSATSTTVATNGQWHHACGVFASATDRRAFIDGGSKGTAVTSRAPTGADRTSVGRAMASTPIEPIAGRICEVVIWNVALSDAEVAALAKGITPFLIRPGAIVMYMPLWGIASPETDFTRNRRHMTITGATQGGHAPRVSPLFYDYGYVPWAPSGPTTYEKTGILVPFAVGAGADASAWAELGALIADTTLAGLGSKAAEKSGSLTPDTTLAGVDAATRAELGALLSSGLMAGLPVFTAQPTGSLAAGAVEAGTSAKAVGGVSGSLIASGRLAGVDAITYAELGALISGAVLAGLDVPTYSETGSLVVDTTLAGLDAITYAELGSLTPDTTLAGTSEKTSPGKTGSLVADTTISGVDASTFAELGALLSTGRLAGVDQPEYINFGSLSPATRLAGIDAITFAETGSLLPDTTLAGADATTYAELGSLVAGAFIAGASFKTSAAGKTGSLVADTSTSGADVSTFAELGSLIADTTLAGVDQREVAKVGALIVDTMLAGLKSETTQKSGFFAARTFLAGVDSAIYAEFGTLMANAFAAGIKSGGSGKNGTLAAYTQLIQDFYIFVADYNKAMAYIRRQNTEESLIFRRDKPWALIERREE